MLFAAIVINALSVLILYVLVYTIFFKLVQIEERQNDIESVNRLQETQHQNLIRDMNYNNLVLKAYLNKEGEAYDPSNAPVDISYPSSITTSGS
jgi:hypothetical protein